MLNPRQAREELKKYEVRNPQLRRQLMISRLPIVVQPLFTHHNRYAHNWRSDPEQRRIKKQYERALRWLGSNWILNHRRVLNALFPGFSKQVLNAWKLADILPYQTGSDRKAFRCPNNRAVVTAARASWITSLFQATFRYKANITWLAEWAPYLPWGSGRSLGILFGGVISQNDRLGDEVYQILVDSATGDHPVGSMGSHVTNAMLISSRPEGWQFIENLLLAAQRQEGLRQSILEAVDLSHPEAFTRMLKLILDENLIRFSSTIRAANVWFGLGYDARQKNKLKRCLEIVNARLSSGQDAPSLNDDEAALASYLDLWVQAFKDAEKAIPAAGKLLHSDQPSLRFAGAHLLGDLKLVQANHALLTAIDDPELAIAARAVNAFLPYPVNSSMSHSDLFERLERNLDRFPKKKKKLRPDGFSSLNISTERSQVAGLLVRCLGKRSPKRLIPHLSAMDPHSRGRVASLLSQAGRWDKDRLDIFIQLLGDRSSTVRQKAIDEIGKHKIPRDQLPEIESLLTRKAGDLRRGLISLLLDQKDPVVLASAQRLLESGNHQQHLAGLEILRLMIEANRRPKSCSQLSDQYTEKSSLTGAEQVLVEQIEQADDQPPALENGLGLFNPKHQSQPTPPRRRRALVNLPRRGPIVSTAAGKCLLSLEKLLHEHRHEEVTLVHQMGEKNQLLGNLRWLPANPGGEKTKSWMENFPLKDLLSQWWIAEGEKLVDEDPLVIFQALSVLDSLKPHPRGNQPGLSWQSLNARRLHGKSLPGEVKYYGLLINSLKWLILAYSAAPASDYLLDALELCLSLIPRRELSRQPPENQLFRRDWRHTYNLLSWMRTAKYHRDHFPADWETKHHQRIWGLLRWMDEPGPAIPRSRPALLDLYFAFEAGAANEADVIDHLIGDRPIQRYGLSSFNDFSTVSRKNPPRPFADSEAFLEIVDRCRKRVCEVELGRGELPTEASRPAIALRWSGGGEVFIDTLAALGKTKLVRGWSYDPTNKASVLSRILRATFPGPEDDRESFGERLSASKLKNKQILDAAVYAPQWAGHIEHWLGWEGFEEGVWWLHAHTKDTRWSVEGDIREEWTAEINRRTPLTARDLLDGAVDVRWFHEMYDQLGDDRWGEIYESAVYASGGAGHTRAKLFADAMLGNLSEEEVLDRLIKKRHQDSARALGLVPLPEGDTRKQAILKRYQSLQEFLRTGKKFGAQRKASEKLAVQIGMDNLARTAGFPDPSRLQWAMEIDEISDLSRGPVVITSDEYQVSLSLNELGEPRIKSQKGDRTLKSIPAKLRKNPEIKELKARKKAIRRQTTRMRVSLEEAMCRRDSFEGSELRSLQDHPVLKPMLSQLLFTDGIKMGFLVEGGQELIDYQKSTVRVNQEQTYYLVHPFDLLEADNWHDWQRDCFQQERVQPFKQIFRELYVLTPQERQDGQNSLRYAGHQVNPRQALAILGKRGWVTNPEQGIQRTFHHQRLTAHVTTDTGIYTPQQIEGLTLNSVYFSRRGEWQPLPLSELSPLVFSETMRDLDLVVSVAHMGGVDPETSASTVELRTAIVKETCVLLDIDNVTIKGNHALISGTLSDYSVHLGSGVVHRQPGGAICMVPVHAQHRGRIFLPFVDDDPRTAEVTAKVLLLARDQEIKDPTILEQLVHS